MSVITRRSFLKYARELTLLWAWRGRRGFHTVGLEARRMFHAWLNCPRGVG